MDSYYCIHMLSLKTATSASDLEAMLRTRVVEMERWVPGVHCFSLLRTKALADETDVAHYIMTITFDSMQAYTYWRQVEEEAYIYWPQLASVLQQCEQMSTLVEEYQGFMVMHEELSSDL